MRISNSKSLHLIEFESEDKPPILVLVDASSGAEIELSPDEVDRLLSKALPYFYTKMHKTPEDLATQIEDYNTRTNTFNGMY